MTHMKIFNRNNHLIHKINYYLYAGMDSMFIVYVVTEIILKLDSDSQILTYLVLLVSYSHESVCGVIYTCQE